MPYINLCCTMILKRIWFAGGVCLRHTCMPCIESDYADTKQCLLINVIKYCPRLSSSWFVLVFNKFYNCPYPHMN